MFANILLYSASTPHRKFCLGNYNTASSHDSQNYVPLRTGTTPVLTLSNPPFHDYFHIIVRSFLGVLTYGYNNTHVDWDYPFIKSIEYTLKVFALLNPHWKQSIVGPCSYCPIFHLLLIIHRLYNCPIWNFQFPVSGLWIQDSGLRFLASGLCIPDSGFWILDYGI